MMNRRQVLAATLSPLLLAVGRQAGATAAPLGAQRSATAWHLPGGGSSDGGQRVGVVEIDWDAGSVHLSALQPVPARAHGLLALADGGFVAVANRPGRWLMRCDAAGAVAQQIDTTADPSGRTLNGHVAASADGHWLYTTETDPATGAGWVGVRDARTLARVAQFSSGGIDPHQLLRATDGTLLVANGGILRDAWARKVKGERMAPTLVRIAPGDGQVQGRWTLPDAQISLRHLAWAHAREDGHAPLLGVALQAEHDAPEARAVSPLLAVWDGTTLSVPSTDATGSGYAGDIAAGPGGGFVLSAQKAGRGLWWHPGRPERLTTVAELTEPCALLPLPDGAGVALSAGRGVARWHATQAPRLLRWPVPLAPDHHWVALAKA
jgi:hypothetical protein